MPQMAPMNWIFLFIYFFILFLIFNMLNYYIFNSQPKFKSSKKKINMFLNWKW